MGYFTSCSMGYDTMRCLSSGGFNMSVLTMKNKDFKGDDDKWLLKLVKKPILGTGMVLLCDDMVPPWRLHWQQDVFLNIFVQ